MLGWFPCVFLIAIPFILLIGAAILRGAVSLANKTVGGAEPRPYYGDDDDWDDYPLARKRGLASSEKIPVPTLGWGMLILIVVLIASAVVNFGVSAAIGIGVAANAVGFRGAFQVIGLPIGFLVLATMLTMMLPTSFGRGCLVSLFYYLICIAIAIVIFVPILVLGFAVG